MYRAFFALPASLVDGEGRPINALHGYLDMTARLIGELQPNEIVHVFDDDWRPAPRVAVYAGYKANRPEDPPDLPRQFDMLREVLAVTGMTEVGAPGWEADDAIGTICAQAGPGTPIDIVTGDRDLLQLVRDNGPVRLLYTGSAGKIVPFDEAAVLEKYGVPAARYADFAMLRGDPSDGLPGVKGVGEKTAQQLVQRYATIDALLDDLDAQPPRLAANLAASRAYLEAMRQVVPVRRDAELRRAVGARDDAQLDVMRERFNVNGPIRRLREELIKLQGASA